MDARKLAYSENQKSEKSSHLRVAYNFFSTDFDDFRVLSDNPFSFIDPDGGYDECPECPPDWRDDCPECGELSMPPIDVFAEEEWEDWDDWENLWVRHGNTIDPDALNVFVDQNPHFDLMASKLRSRAKFKEKREEEFKDAVPDGIKLTSMFAKGHDLAPRKGIPKNNTSMDELMATKAFQTGLPGNTDPTFWGDLIKTFSDFAGELGFFDDAATKPSVTPNNKTINVDSTVTMFISRLGNDSSLFIEGEYGGFRISNDLNDTLNRNFKMKTYVSEY